MFDVCTKVNRCEIYFGHVRLRLKISNKFSKNQTWIFSAFFFLILFLFYVCRSQLDWLYCGSTHLARSYFLTRMVIRPTKLTRPQPSWMTTINNMVSRRFFSFSVDDWNEWRWLTVFSSPPASHPPFSRSHVLLEVDVASSLCFERCLFPMLWYRSHHVWIQCQIQFNRITTKKKTFTTITEKRTTGHWKLSEIVAVLCSKWAETVVHTWDCLV